MLCIECGYRSLLANIGEQVNDTNIHDPYSLQVQVILYLDQSGDATAKLTINFTELDTGRTSSADPERRCLQKKEKLCEEMSVDRPAVTPSILMYM